MGSNARGNKLLKHVVQSAENGGGFVYVIAFGPDGPVKIGKSVRPRTRIAGIETSCGMRFKHIYVTDECANFDQMEADLHERLDEHRGIGEWFAVPFLEAVGIVARMNWKKAKSPPVTEEQLRIAAERGGQPPCPVIAAMAVRAGYDGYIPNCSPEETMRKYA